MRKTTKVISLAIVLTLVFSLFSTMAFAQPNDSQISKDEAGTMAIIFIADSIQAGNTTWDKDIRIKKIVPLYGADDTITAYTFELSKNGQDNGYVTVSASDDMNVIQEFSDTATPIYSDMIKDGSEQVYFTSALEYYVKGKKGIFDARGKKVEKAKIKNKFKKDKKVSDENKLLRKLIKDKGTLNLDQWKLGSTPGNPYGGIPDAYAYVNDAYGSGWVADYWKSLESKITKHLCTEKTDNNNCSLTALATIFEYWKNYGGASSLPSGYSAIYADIKKIASDNGWYTPENGTDYWVIDDIATKMWYKYNYTNGRGNNDYILDWSVAMAEIDQGRPFCFNLATNPYPNHTIVVYAYSAFKRNWWEGDVCFLKVADGWHTDSRYIDWNQFIGFGSWTKVFKS